jgi:hypothetical protein
MSTKISVEELLGWRAEQSAADAPPVPRASRLLELSRPWWEIWPEKFKSIADQLGTVQMRYGHAMVDGAVGTSGRPIPAVLVAPDGRHEIVVHVLYLEIKESVLHLRFEIDAAAGALAPQFECILVSEANLGPLFSASAQGCVDREYFISTLVPESLAREWQDLKVTDQMPFRLILLSDGKGE